MSYHLRRPSVWVVVATAILVFAPLVCTLSQAFWPRSIAILALAWWLPGALLVAHWRLPNLELPLAALLAVGLGLCWMVLLVLLLFWLAGRLALLPFLIVFDASGAILLTTLFWRQPVALEPTSLSTWRWVVVLLLLAALLRLPGLGYHELNLDEVEVLRRAAYALKGMDEALGRHTKGPGEIAIAATVYRALGTIDEAQGRLPFGLMSVASILAIALLGRRLFSTTTGFWAGVLLALNGFALGLSRLVQYQAALLLLSTLSLLAAWEFAQVGRARWLALSAVFSLGSVILHYEFIFFAPVLLLLAWLGWRRTSDKWHVVWTSLGVGLPGGALVAASYLPIVLNARFAQTKEHLAWRLGRQGAFNVPFFVEMGTFYNSTYYFAGLVVLVLAGLALGWRKARRRTLLLTLWFAPLLILHLFVMDLPGTHFYLFMPGWSLCAALPLAAVTESRALRPLIRPVLLGLIATWLALSAGYLYLLFFRQSPAYMADYEQNRVALYWAPYGKKAPIHPRLGLPIRQGWKVLGTLAEWGYLEGTYATNEQLRHVRWYLRGLNQVGLDEAPGWIFVSSPVQSPPLEFDESILESYQRLGEIRVGGEPRIALWGREPLPVAYVTHDLETFEDVFDHLVPALEPWPDPPVQVRESHLGDAMTLESGSLTLRTYGPGDVMHLFLVWRPEQPLTVDYKVFVHVADTSGQPTAQRDALPCFNTSRTCQWVLGEPVSEHILLALPGDIVHGDYQILVGMYDGTTGERLGGRAVQMATITVR
jgi:4-amino-4-deoxy-L-arabinose transferase-like glycosyltransferase